MKPIRDTILVKPVPSDEVSDGGIYVPESCREVSNKVIIVAVGDGTAKKKMFFKEGQIGYRVKDWGEEILVNGEKHYLMGSDAILAVE
jgi:chaperonin GroES